MDENKPIPTAFTKLMGCDYPIIAGPMFLVSNERLVTEVSNAGAMGGTPSLNWRTPEAFRDAVRAIKRGTERPFAVNLIVNKANPRVDRDLAVCIEEKGAARNYFAWKSREGDPERSRLRRQSLL